jgi:hypothetical protein
MASPATSPQKAGPTPATDTPDAVTTKVMIAAIRSSSCPQRSLQRRSQAAEKGEAREGLDEKRGRRRHEGRCEARAEAEQEVADPARDRRDPAARRIGMRVRSGRPARR